MKKVAVALLGILAVSSVQADELSVVGHGFSKHLDNHNFNERNYGVGLRYENENYGLQMGGYRNSLRKESFYAGMDVSPINFNIDGCFNFQAGLFAGGATGYKYTVTPMAGAQAAIRCKDLFVRIRVMPDPYYNAKIVGAVEFGLVLMKF